MKNFILISLIFLTSCVTAQQTETFDVATFKVPEGYVKASNQDKVSYTASNNKSGFCMIGLYETIQQTNDPQKNFELNWLDLIARNYSLTETLSMKETTIKDGWQEVTGGSSFEYQGSTVAVILSTYTYQQSGFSIIYMLNDQDYTNDLDVFINSLTLQLPKINVAADSTTTTDTATNSNTSEPELKQTWFTQNVLSNSLTFSYIKKQYTFKSDGTYTYYIKTFDISWDFILLTRETGTYSIANNKISLKPKKCVLEKWSKKDRADQWGKLLSTTPKKLENTTYQYSMHYFSGIEKWNLVLTPPKQTERDGAFANNTDFSTSYLYEIPPSTDYLITLPN